MRIVSLLASLLLFGACSSTPRPSPEARREPTPSTEQSPASDPRPVIVAFGDSLTAGFGADPGKSFPDFLQKELDGRGLRYRVVNAGVSGETSSDALERLSTVTALKPAVVIVEFGGNDGLRGLPVSAMQSNLDQIITGLKSSGTAVLLAGMTLPPNYGPRYIGTFQEVYRTLATKDNVALIPFLLEGVGGTSRMQQDGLHPTAEGNRIVAATVMRYLQPMLRR